MLPIVSTSPSFDTTALDRADLAPGTYRHYKAALLALFESGVDIYNYDDLTLYANSLPASSKSNLKAALNITLRDMVNRAKMSNASVETIQRFLWLVDVINDVIQVSQPDSERTPHWLSQEQVNTILDHAKADPRDYIVMALLLGSALRREELEELAFDALSQIPDHGKMKDVLTIRGKGDKKRIVPISSNLAKAIREWRLVAGDGLIARRYVKGGKLGKSLSAFGIFQIVRKYGLSVEIDDLDPHDCRRTYGRLMYEATKDVMLVMSLLGHASVKTTMRYIGLDLKLNINDTQFPV